MSDVDASNFMCRLQESDGAFTVVGWAFIDVMGDDGVRLFRVTNSYQVPVWTDAGRTRYWSFFLQERASFLRPADDPLPRPPPGRKDIVGGATLCVQWPMDQMALVLREHGAGDPLVGLDWKLFVPFQPEKPFAFPAGDQRSAPDELECPARITAVEYASITTVGDALQLMRDAMTGEQNKRALAAAAATKAEAEAESARNIDRVRRRRAQGR